MLKEKPNLHCGIEAALGSIQVARDLGPLAKLEVSVLKQRQIVIQMMKIPGPSSHP